MGTSKTGYLLRRIAAKLRELLAAKRLELKTATEGLKVDSADDKVISMASHPADMSFAPDLRGGRADRLMAEIVAIEEAIERAENGTYGICLGCGEGIPVKRLEATPWADRCVPCKSASETSHLVKVGGRYRKTNGHQRFALAAI